MDEQTMQTDHSPTLGALAKALATAQGKIQGARKTAQNPHLKNKYATLADHWDAVREPLSASSLAIVQTTEPHGRDGVCVVTWLLHESGEWMRSRIFMPVGKPDAQGHGSAITYARRYALAAMVGVAPDEDDDANAATGKQLAPEPAKAQPNKAASDATESALASSFTGATSADAIAKAEAEAARAVRAGLLSAEARKRLMDLRAEAVRRVSSEAAAQ